MFLSKRLVAICGRTVIAVLAAALCVPNARASFTFTTVALSGHTVPGGDSGQIFSDLSAPALNSLGQVAFSGGITGTDVTSDNDRAIWSNATGTLNMIVREGDAAPGTAPGSFFRSFNTPILNSAGQIGIRADLIGPGITSFNNHGLWSHRDGGISKVAQARDQAAGAAIGSNYFVVSNAQQNATGRLSFFSSLVDGPVNATNNQGLWSERNGNLTMLARTGEQASGMAPGVTLKSMHDPMFNNQGSVGFRAMLQGAGITSSNNQSIFAERNNTLELVAQSGSSAPGAGSASFTGFFAPSMNDSGHTAFRALLTGGADDSIWSDGGDGTLSLVAREGTSAPGTGQNFSAFLNPVINAPGDTAFVARFGSSGSGLFSQGGDGLHLVARSFGEVPGAEPGVQFANFANPGFTANFVINAQGKVAFLSTLIGTDNNLALMAEVDNELTMIARKGDLFQVAPGDFRTVSFLSFFGKSANQDGRSSGFNDLGQLAFAAEFTDGSKGIFVVDTVPIPEPASLAMLVLAMALGAHSRSRTGSSHCRRAPKY